MTTIPQLLKQLRNTVQNQQETEPTAYFLEELLVMLGSGAGGDFVVANTLLVATNGDDATGTRGDLSKPFASLAGAVAATHSGDLVLLAPGTYNETVTTTVPANVTVTIVASETLTTGNGAITSASVLWPYGVTGISVAVNGSLLVNGGLFNADNNSGVAIDNAGSVVVSGSVIAEACRHRPFSGRTSRFSPVRSLRRAAW